MGELCISFDEIRPEKLAEAKKYDKNHDDRLCQSEFPKMDEAAFEAFVTSIRIDPLIRFRDHHFRKSQFDALLELAAINNIKIDKLLMKFVTKNGVIIELNLSNLKLTDIRPLSRLIYLWNLELNGNDVSDISALSALKDLLTLNLSGTKVSNIGPLLKLNNLQILVLDNTNVTDLRPLSKLKDLGYLSLKGARLPDLRALTKLKKLSYLDLSNTELSDVRPLAGLKKLTYLNLSDTKVRDLHALFRLTNLKELKLLNLSVNTNQLRNLCKHLKKTSPNIDISLSECLHGCTPVLCGEEFPPSPITDGE